MSGSPNLRHVQTPASFPAHMHVFEWGRQNKATFLGWTSSKPRMCIWLHILQSFISGFKQFRMILHCIFLRWLKLFFSRAMGFPSRGSSGFGWTETERHWHGREAYTWNGDSVERVKGCTMTIDDNRFFMVLLNFWIHFHKVEKGFTCPTVGAFGVTRRQAHRNRHMMTHAKINLSLEKLPEKFCA